MTLPLLDTLIYRDTKGSNLDPIEGDANMRAIVNAVDRLTINPYYHFHGYAGTQLAGDGKFFDLAVGNHGVRGANLSDAQMFANAGFVTTIDPTGGSTDSVIRIPALNFSYESGEKLFVWWLGKVTDEGATDAAFMGSGSSNTYPGIRVKTSGTNQVAVDICGTTGSTGFGASSTVTHSDGTLQEFAFALDGENRKYIYISNGSIQSSFSNDWANYNVANNYTISGMGTWNIGAAMPVGAASTDGVVTQTRALIIVRFPASYPAPTAVSLVAACRVLRAHPSKLLLASAF